ncbi:MAG: nitrous oxide reductase accessory protein NosL [Cytophagales bacterium]|nr:nitrous oxide reductase accessory protein NosL [Cytophagales bacterium]
MHKLFCYIQILFLVAVLGSCSQKSEPIQFGKDQCALCVMNIADKNYGAEIVSDKGKVYKFDAVECMIHYMMKNDTEGWAPYAVAFHEGGKLFKTSELKFYRSVELPSPMGRYITALHEDSIVKKVSKKHPGKFYTFDELKAQFHDLPVLAP